MTRSKTIFWAVLACLTMLLILAGLRAQPHSTAQGIPTIFVNTTTDEDLAIDDTACEEGKPCSLRRAIRSAQLELNGAFITACFLPSEVPGARACPEGKIPLRKSDPRYDPALDRWVIKMTDDLPYSMISKQTFVDFKRMLGDWEGAADNKVIVDGSGLDLECAFSLESTNNILAGFEIRGDFDRAAVMIRPSIRTDPSRNNQIGPGVVFAHIPKGKGIHILGKETTNNKVFGIWCGVTGDGTEVAPLEDDCIFMEQGTTGNVIGDVANPNILAASNGSGLRIEDFPDPPGVDLPPTRDNEIRGNWLGLDAKGDQSFGLETGVTIIYAPDNRITENVISNKRGAGVRLFEPVTSTLIISNTIGGDPSGKLCRPNGSYGVWMLSGAKKTEIRGNTIMCNEQGGIFMQGTNTRENKITANEITRNKGPKPITLSQGANRGVRAPRITGATRTSVIGTACANCTVEVFTDPNRQAAVFEGRTKAGADGVFRLDKSEGFTDAFITATATDTENNSSELAEAVEISAAPTVPPQHTATPTLTPTTLPTVATATPSTPTPATPTPSPTGDGRGKIFMPWSANGASP
jgi:hypothetical protein